MSYIVTAPLVLAHGTDGRTYHHYHGEIIEWLDDQQHKHFLETGLVQEIEPAEVVAIADAQARRQQQADQAEADRVRQCVNVLNAIELPLTAGAPAARAAVRAHGHRIGNDTIATAVKQRREMSRTAALPAWPEVAAGPAIADGQG
jgi:hypothetical protein